MDQDSQGRETARRDSGRTVQMPRSKAPLPFARSFTQEEVDRISLGLVPQRMEDKWFIKECTMTHIQFLRTISVLPVADIQEAIDWYQRAMGFEAVYLHEGEHPGEATSYAILRREGLEVHLILDEDELDFASWSKAGSGYLYLKVRGVDAVFSEVRGRGAQIARGLRTENWGARGFNLRDPSGNAIHVEEET